MNINFEYYKIFYNVAKNKNITRTANELMISQPAISKSIKNLEEQIGCSLFTRNKAGVILTEVGKVLYEEIKHAMEIIENAEEKLNEMINLDCGILNIGISNTLTRNYLLSYIKKFNEMYPKVTIKVHTEPSFELVNKARKGLVDFIILNLPYNVPGDFEKYNLVEIHDCFVANSKFIELKDKVISLEELNNYPLILLAQGSNGRFFLDETCNKLGINLKPKFELASYSLVTEFIKSGIGIGLLTKEFIQDELNNQELFEVITEPSLSTNSRNIGVIYLSQKALSHCSKEFLALLKQ